MTTYILTITDMSGSMSPVAKDVRGGFNSYIKGLIEDQTECLVTATLFDTDFVTLCMNKVPAEVPELNNSNYVPPVLPHYSMR